MRVEEHHTMRRFISGLVVVITGLMLSPAAFAAEGSDGAVTFHKDVLPILQKNCQTCHRPGQSAPMPLLNYEAARPWARAIKQAVSTRKMPPWFASPDTSHFVKNDRSLGQAEIDTLVKWADSGAPAGDPKDAPAPIQWPADGWQIKPDIIVEGPTYDVPARKIVEWTWVPFPSNFTKDTWVTSIEVLPAQPQVTHHLCLAFRPYAPDVKFWVPQLNQPDIERDEDGVEILKPRPAAQQQQTQVGGGIEECYEPGRQAADFRPYGAAKLIPAGTVIWLNLHYTPNGTAVTDHVRIGFTVAKDQPKRRYLALSGSAPSDRKIFAIPPFDGNYEAPAAEFTFAENVELVGLMPHMHVRGKSNTFYLVYPDGRSEKILDVPRYDFNWQLWYDTSIKVQKGTKLRVIAHYDNSPNNKFNPDPSKTVYYGNQTWEEMHFPSFGVVVDDLSLDQRKVLTRTAPPGAN
jgi:hypothetical protein